MNELATAPQIDGKWLTAQEIRAGVNLIQQVMDAVMKKDVHYGVIPGTQKPTLYKAGAEKILSTFRIAVEPQVEDLSTSDEARFRVVTKGTHQGTGAFLGSGVGEASSNEEKYKWRRAVCDEEWVETPEDRRREKWAKGSNGTYQIRQVRTNIADVANTCLKMAKKRSQIDLTLTVTAASDCFSQDLEDMPEEVREAVSGGEKKPIEQPKAQTEPSTDGVLLVSCKAIKTGTNDKGPWTAYKITDASGKDYFTYDDALAQLAGQVIAGKKKVSLDSEPTSKGGLKLLKLETVA